MDGACSSHGRDSIFLQNFRQKILEEKRIGWRFGSGWDMKKDIKDSGYPVTGCCEHGHESCGYVRPKQDTVIWLSLIKESKRACILLHDVYYVLPNFCGHKYGTS